MTKTTSGACAKINQVDINEGPREESAIVPVPPALVVAVPSSHDNKRQLTTKVTLGVTSANYPLSRANVDAGEALRNLSRR